MSKAEEKALMAYPEPTLERITTDVYADARKYYTEGYEQAMRDLEEKIALVKKNGSWDGVDVDEFMSEMRGH